MFQVINILHQSWYSRVGIGCVHYQKTRGVMAEDRWLALCQLKNISYEVLGEIRTKNYLTLKQRMYFMFSRFFQKITVAQISKQVFCNKFFFNYLFFLGLDLWEVNFCCFFCCCCCCLLMCISAFCKINGCFQYTQAFAFRNKKCGLQNSVRKTFICVLNNIQSKFFPLMPKKWFYISQRGINPFSN